MMASPWNDNGLPASGKSVAARGAQATADPAERRALAGRPVDEFAQDIGVAQVMGRFDAHVHQDLRQGQATQSQPPDLQEVAPRNAVAEALSLSVNRQHRSPLPRLVVPGF